MQLQGIPSSKAGAQHAYLVSCGMITPVGGNSAQSIAAVRAGINQYCASEYSNGQNLPITMALVPDAVFSAVQFDIEESDYYSAQYDRIIKMAVLALREAVAGQSFKNKVPLILAMPEPTPSIKQLSAATLINNLIAQSGVPLETVRTIHTGRAAGIQGLDLALRYLHEANDEYVLLGGVDSYNHFPLINKLDNDGRLLAPGVKDGFAPGEGAGFLLLARRPENAISGAAEHVIAIRLPGVGEESGHLGSEQNYTGDGLDQAFRHALKDYDGEKIGRAYCSMNGERYWAKEYGVAVIRNQRYLNDDMQLEHPADCFGDLGAASGPVLIALAADDLARRPESTSLVFCSSDGAWRAAVRLEKIIRNI